MWAGPRRHLDSVERWRGCGGARAPLEGTRGHPEGMRKAPRQDSGGCPRRDRGGASLFPLRWDPLHLTPRGGVWERAHLSPGLQGRAER